VALPCCAIEDPKMTVHDYSAKTIDGEDRTLSDYKGQVMVIVNTASKCGFTPQYKGLETMFREFRGRGLVVLGFPCDQFGHQEPGDENEIKKFCSLNYDVSFPMFSKVAVNGDHAHPLFKYLKNEAPGLLGSRGIKWNFTKFLVDKSGKVLKRYGSVAKPESIIKDIEKLL
jgi:glutathione peroxidase